jgi:hypothetical protein
MTSAKHSNLRLIYTSEYIQQFDISVYYKPSKMNMISNTLFWLKSTTKVEENTELDFESKYISIAYNFIVTIVEISSEFKERLIQEYTINLAF